VSPADARAAVLCSHSKARATPNASAESHARFRAARSAVGDGRFDAAAP
jgi:hypothetical protein